MDVTGSDGFILGEKRRHVLRMDFHCKKMILAAMEDRPKVQVWKQGAS